MCVSWWFLSTLIRFMPDIRRSLAGDRSSRMRKFPCRILPNHCLRKPVGNALLPAEQTMPRNSPEEAAV
jgi:hypothetical protein